MSHEKFLSKVKKRIESKKELWIDIFSFQYALILLDRIGRRELSYKDSAAIWGESYLTTYYKWINRTLSDRPKMEGGIATTYFVLKSLKEFWSLANVDIPDEIKMDTLDFINSHTKEDGKIGIIVEKIRGDFEIDANLRHSSFGVLILDLLDELEIEKCKQLWNYLTRFEDYTILWDSIFKESWPVGGISSYVAAIECLLKTDFEIPKKREIQIRISIAKLVEFLISLESKSVVNSKGNQNKYSSKNTLTSLKREFYPYWDPIFGLDELRLHSTLGCLELVGDRICNSKDGRARIRLIKNDLNQKDGIEYSKCDYLDQKEGKDYSGFKDEQLKEIYFPTKQFSLERTPSICASFASLNIYLGSWSSLTESDMEVILSLLDFIESNWSDFNFYDDYWTEFIAPILVLDVFREVLADDYSQIHKKGLEIQESIIASSKINKTTNSDHLNIVEIAFGISVTSLQRVK